MPVQEFDYLCMNGMGIYILQVIPVGLVDSLMIHTGIVLQVVRKIKVALHRIARGSKEVGIGIDNHPAENNGQNQETCSQNCQQGDGAFLHKSTAKLSGNIAKIGYFMQ